ncbi:tetratricopeptide repeat protein [Gimesia panareensis]|uniref:hypothetical protein n=1 Tax=Gimesia panareensis TaxID=2527978 RepID=UPI00118CA794|nr:hypothetical protein [Gimesia panareensis]QDU50502.1 hypothetical protein Pan110_28530 [Gimesia panareensis]
MLNQNEQQQRLEVINQKIATKPDDSELCDLLIERAHIYDSLKDDVASIKDYFAALDVASDREKVAHINSMISLALLTHDKKEEALWWAMAAVDRAPDGEEANYVLGMNLAISEFHNMAVESFKKTLDINPEHKEAFLAWGVNVSKNLKRLTEGREILTSYTKKYPTDAKGLFELAFATYMSSVGPNFAVHLFKAKELFEKTLTLECSERLVRRIKDLLEEIDILIASNNL